jgi:hypothetical protein
LVTINPCAEVNGGGNSMVVEGNSTFTMYPNPNRGDQLFLSVSNVEEGVNTVNVDIFDMTGKRVMARTIAVQDGFVNTPGTQQRVAQWHVLGERHRWNESVHGAVGPSVT